MKASPAAPGVAFFGVSALGGSCLLVLLAATTYAQTVSSVDGQALVSDPLLGNETTAVEGDSIHAFQISVPEQQLVDLRQRLEATRWPDKETVNDESQGIRLAE